MIIRGEACHIFKIVAIISRKLGLLLLTILTLMKLAMDLDLQVDQLMCGLGLLVAHLMFVVHILDHSSDVKCSVIWGVSWGVIWASAVLGRLP